MPLGSHSDCSTSRVRSLCYCSREAHVFPSHWSCDMNHAIIRTAVTETNHRPGREATPVRSADWTIGKPPRGGPYRAEVPLLSLPLSFSLPHPSLPPQPPSHPSRPFHSISLSISVLLCSFLFHRLSVFYSSTFFHSNPRYSILVLPLYLLPILL